jgi:hypothetical protein
MARAQLAQTPSITARVIPPIDPKNPQPDLSLTDMQNTMHDWPLMPRPQNVDISTLQKANVGVCAGLVKKGKCTSGRCYVVWLRAVPLVRKESSKVEEGVFGLDLETERGVRPMVVYFAGEGRCDCEELVGWT